MEKLKLHKISYLDEGKKIIYDYSVDSKLQKLFDKEHPFYAKYGIDVSDVPDSISVIPFLSNVLPIAWFGDFKIEIPELDEDFYNAVSLVKIEFEKQYPTHQLGGELIVKKLVKNSIIGSESAMLFSGGVDAYATYIRVKDKTPDLITILGADIGIDDQSQWKDFTDFVETEKLLKKNGKEYIETNVRGFYTYQVELLLEDIGWWGKVQHGLSLIGSVAPISYVNSYSSIYIASSYTKEVDVAWGSTPEIDNKITWASVQVIHDGYELKRQDKVDLIAQFASESNTKFKLRVCYSEFREEFNCSNCEKCFRTILGIILNDKDPNDYGFNVNMDVYTKIFETIKIGGATTGLKYFWWELMEKAKNSDQFYVFNNKDVELLRINEIREGKIDRLLEEKLNNQNKGKQRLKFIFRNKFPWLIDLYKKIKK
ncbi:hypothetical protein [uncultured Aquimarina sp.]|uniref:hypothetical protein n=1 Tax=uncultured Aquimarina sp. TaxID=575652 RepID=UPI0026368192|nr:hypothetical protein [uncultured Aquimarina sp.]